MDTRRGVTGHVEGIEAIRPKDETLTFEGRKGLKYRQINLPHAGGPERVCTDITESVERRPAERAHAIVNTSDRAAAGQGARLIFETWVGPPPVPDVAVRDFVGPVLIRAHLPIRVAVNLAGRRADGDGLWQTAA